jgi:type II secretion system protein D
LPDVQAAPEKVPADPVEVRHVPLKRIQADQLEAALWNTLGNRLTAVPEKRPASRGYRLAMSAGGAVTIWIDQGTHQVKLEGSAAAVEAAARLVHVLDLPQDPAGRNVRLMPVQPAQLTSIQRAASIMRTANGGSASAMPLAALLMQPRPDAPAAGGISQAPAPPAPAARPDVSAASGARSGEKAGEFGDFSRIVNPVQMDVIEGLDVLVLRGSAQDVEQMMEVVRQIERLSAETEPAINILSMKHIDSGVMASLAKALYVEVYMPRQGAVSITPLAIPNAILIVGRPENVKTVQEIVARLDQPAVPGAQFQVFHLRFATASAAQTTIQNFFLDRGGGLSPAVHVTADPRSTALIVQASPRDMAEVAELIRQIDVSHSAAVNEVRIIRLEHSLAQDIATIMQTAIGISTGAAGQAAGAQGAQPGGQPQGQGGQFAGPGGPGGPFGQQFGPGGQPQGQGQNVPGMQAGRQQSEQRAAMLSFLMVDAKGRRLLNSGILTDVRITADVRANALVISSPPENLELLEGLVRQLDNLPAAQAQIKVFTIVNGDAQNLSDMLKTLFTGQATGTAAGPQQIMQLLQNTSSNSQTSMVPLRFGVDTRTNSVIASGTMADLNIVEAILTKLDDGEVRHRRSVVIRLKNSPATDVATTINQFLTTERQILQQAGPGLTSAFEQIEREVVVVAEPVTNSLVLSATPKYFEEVKGIIEQLDARPPMVMIQVMIASVDCGSTNEFGIELGLQDSVLFDRSILSNPVTTSITTPTGASTTTVISANQSPGFNFNNGNDLGNSAAGFGPPISPSSVGGQGISNFGVGRTNSTLGYSGLVLSAASENVSALLRALSENHRVDILQRPQIMTLDNQPAFIQVGQRVPRITAVSNNAVTGNTNSITLDNVGLILGVTPRISPDGLVVMQIDAEKSELESTTSGIPIYTGPTGQVIYSPIIDATTAQTTVAAMSEQTVVLGGLITKTETKEHHGVPVLDDIPVVNNFFRYDSVIKDKSELLIIMTPHIVRNQAEAEALKRAEAAKMTWCLNDVTEIYGEAGLRRRTDLWTNGEVPVIYPDGAPLGPGGSQPAGPEVIPTPTSQPVGPGNPPPPQAPAAPPASGPGPLPGSGPVSPDPSAATSRFPAPQQPAYGAQYGTQPPAAVPGVQPVNYQLQPWQQGNAAQPTVYQAPVADQPTRLPPVPSINYQQPPPSQ